ncbi:hypothetical protein SAMN05216559_3883 [Halomicrobium zhouii]|uniref:Uncharacterized protein n=2 Tax=Halomicrobium zhouii TaxID=767519 RepID=A0A1I6M745_9EURY|nr:hypothetical protein SAMN05216559_3883 [Halomicrobium zhouii]
MSTVVDLTADGDADEGEDGQGDAGSEGVDGAGDAASTDPFAGGHIEIDESAVRAVSPSAWLGGVKRRIDDAIARLTYHR